MLVNLQQIGTFRIWLIRVFLSKKAKKASKSFTSGCLKTKVNSTIVTKFSTIRSIHV